ncbi:MAG TPA: HAD family phosphatase [Bacillota bacterium]
MKLALIIFDMDGLIFDTERLAITAWRLAGADMGFDIPAQVIIETIGTNIQGTEAIFKSRLGPNLPFEQLKALRFDYTWRLMDENGIPVKKGVYELLTLLESKSIPKAVATSTERSKTEELLRRADLIHRFDLLVCGDEVARSKPEPDIFLAAAERLHCVPRECMVLEDSERGIIAASRAGMLPVLVPDIKPPAAEVRTLAHREFPSLLGVAEYIRQIT